VGKAQRAHHNASARISINGGHGASAPLSYCVIFFIACVLQYWLCNKDIAAEF
jgi:hypothetical protein